VAAIWGLPFAIPVSIVSMLAFNWLFLPQTHTLRLADSENWVALAVYLVTAISVSELSARARPACGGGRAAPPRSDAGSRRLLAPARGRRGRAVPRDHRDAGCPPTWSSSWPDRARSRRCTRPR
jgi:hypothetical protein